MWALPVLQSKKILSLPPVFVLLSYLAPFGPGLAAIILSLKHEGRRKTRVFLSNMWTKGFPVIWLIPITLIGPITVAILFIVYEIFGKELQWQYALPPALYIPIFLAILLGNGMAEEYGWRGYLQPKMDRHFPLAVSGVIIGIIWAFWHLPLVLIQGTVQSNIPFYQYLLQTILFAILYAWISYHTKYSILAAVMFHTISNFSAAAVPFWVDNWGRWLQFGVLSVIVLLVIRLDRRNMLSRPLERSDGTK